MIILFQKNLMNSKLFNQFWKCNFLECQHDDEHDNLRVVVFNDFTRKKMEN